MATIQAAMTGSVVLTAQTITPSDSSVTNSSVAANAAILATKLQHRNSAFYSDNSATTTATAVHPLYMIHGTTASVVALQCGNVVACVGAATIVVDLKKNNVSVLSSTLTLNSSNTARVAVPATINTAGAVQGDLYELSVTATAGGGTVGTGFYARLTIDEDAA